MRVLTAAALLLALPAATVLANEGLDLDVRPVLCVTDSRNSSCDMSFVIIWQSIETGYYCLFNDFGDSPVRCWQQARDGELTDERTVSTAFSYWMTGTDLVSRLAQVDVEVLRMDSDDRRRKRRTRHVWDIN